LCGAFFVQTIRGLHEKNSIPAGFSVIYRNSASAAYQPPPPPPPPPPPDEPPPPEPEDDPGAVEEDEIALENELLKLDVKVTAENDPKDPPEYQEGE
jgi:hypothetical protein